MITINNHTYEGEFSGKDVSNALCNSFQKKPTVCRDNIIGTMLGDNKVKYTKMFNNDDSFWQIIAGCIVAILVNCGIVYIIKMSGKKS